MRPAKSYRGARRDRLKKRLHDEKTYWRHGRPTEFKVKPRWPQIWGMSVKGHARGLKP